MLKTAFAFDILPVHVVPFTICFEWPALTHALRKIDWLCRVKTLFKFLVFLEIAFVWVLIDYGHAKHGGKTWNARPWEDQVLGTTSVLPSSGSCRWLAAIVEFISVVSAPLLRHDKG